MNIEIRLSPNKSSRPTDAPIDMIVIHATASLSFDNSLSWMLNKASQVSCHYLIGKDGKIVQLVPDALKAYHAGISSWDGRSDLNRFSIGIELVNLNDKADEYPKEQMASLSLLVADLMRKYAILPRNVVGHNMIAPLRKTDPGPKFPWFDLGYRLGLQFNKTIT